MNRLKFALGLLAFWMGAHAVAAVSVTRTVTYDYDATGFRTQEVVQPNDAELRQQTDYKLDAYGNRTEIRQFSLKEQNAGRAATRTTTITYESTGRFPQWTSNALGYETYTRYSASFGVLASKWNPDDTYTDYYPDGLGRPYIESYMDDWVIRTQYVLCATDTASCLNAQDAFYFTYRQQYLRDDEDDGVAATTFAPKRTFYDVLNRPVRSEVLGMDGRWAGVDTTYDEQGRVTAVSHPYFVGDARYLDTKQYDDLNRLSEEAKADGGVITYSYAGFRATATNKLSAGDTAGQQTTKMRDSRDQIVEVVDANGKRLQMIYAPFGNLDRTFDSNQNQIKNTFDDLGHKKSTSDPDMGAWTYSYDGWGQLWVQTDAKGQTATYSYDILGRKTSLVEADLKSYWEYDGCLNGVGRLCVSRSDNGYRQDLSYDWRGYPSKTVTQLDGQSYTVTSSIDGHGRMLQQGYPASPAYPSGLLVNYDYDADKGYLKRVYSPSLGQTIWTAGQMDAAGHSTYERFGSTNDWIDADGYSTDMAVHVFHGYSPKTGRIAWESSSSDRSGQTPMYRGYTWDARGNLIQRTDYADNTGFTENFLYDPLNRITHILNPQQATQEFQYDDLGNITYRSDVGTYTYGSSRPHAVTTTTGTVNASYQYDLNGAQVSGNNRTIDYTSFNLPKHVQRGSWTDDFIYGPDHQRVRQVNPEGTIYYLNPDNAGGLLFEKEVKANGVVEYKHYINAAGKPVAVYTSRSNGVNDVKLWISDYQGSLAGVTNYDGTVVEQLSYEAFGKRRYVNATLDAANVLRGQTTDRGYTGHEHLDEVGLIHMNGRVYDPQLARFVSPDPTVPNPEWMQDFNRYSYVLNNPFTYTDPTGFDEGGESATATDSGAETATTATPSNVSAAKEDKTDTQAKVQDAAKNAKDTTKDEKNSKSWVGKGWDWVVEQGKKNHEQELSPKERAYREMVEKYERGGLKNVYPETAVIGGRGLISLAKDLLEFLAEKKAIKEQKESHKKALETTVKADQRAGVGKSYQPSVKGVQEGVDPTTIPKGEQNILKEDALAKAQARRDEAIDVRGGRVYDGNHRLENAIRDGRSIDLFNH